MISSAVDTHQKHAKLSRPSYGEWGRKELAIVGTTCEDCKALAKAIIQQLPQYKVAYVDADHKNAADATPKNSVIQDGAFIEFTDKISYTQYNAATQLNAFQKRALFTDCDLILVNGNHFTASAQIVVVDDRKPLEKKLDKLTDVKMILVRDSPADVPSFLMRHIPDIDALPCLSFDDKDSISKSIKQYLQHQTPAINGLVLSGGQSTRMGKDKGSIFYHNKSQRDYVFDLLQTQCSDVFISCNAQQARLHTHTQKIEDTFLNLGPIGGILSAFQQAPNAAWLTVACDLPFLNEHTIKHLITHRNPSKMATAFWDVEDKFPEPLVTIWEPKAYPVLLHFLAQGYSCPRKALINNDVEMLQAPDASAFTNVNTKEEYQEALVLLQKKD